MFPHDTEGAVGEEELALLSHHPCDPPPLRGREGVGELQRLPAAATPCVGAARAQRVE
jgi:hypothetical protein